MSLLADIIKIGDYGRVFCLDEDQLEQLYMDCKTIKLEAPHDIWNEKIMTKFILDLKVMGTSDGDDFKINDYKHLYRKIKNFYYADFSNIPSYLNDAFNWICKIDDIEDYLKATGNMKHRDIWCYLLDCAIKLGSDAAIVRKIEVLCDNATYIEALSMCIQYIDAGKAINSEFIKNLIGAVGGVSGGNTEPLYLFGVENGLIEYHDVGQYYAHIKRDRDNALEYACMSLNNSEKKASLDEVLNIMGMGRSGELVGIYVADNKHYVSRDTFRDILCEWARLRQENRQLKNHISAMPGSEEYFAAHDRFYSTDMKMKSVETKITNVETKNTPSMENGAESLLEDKQSAANKTPKTKLRLPENIVKSLKDLLDKRKNI